MIKVFACDFSNGSSKVFDSFVPKLKSLSKAKEVLAYEHSKDSKLVQSISNHPNVIAWKDLDYSVRGLASYQASKRDWGVITSASYLEYAGKREINASQAKVRKMLSRKIALGFVKCRCCGIETINTSLVPDDDSPNLYYELMQIRGFRYYHVDTCACNYALRRYRIAGAYSILSDDSEVQAIMLDEELGHRAWYGQGRGSYVISKCGRSILRSEPQVVAS